MLRYLLPALLVSTACHAANQCPQPTYQGMTSGALMRFSGETGDNVFSEHGTIETVRPRHIFNFSTTHSNGFSREYLTIAEFPDEKVSSPVLRKNSDFTMAREPGAFLITPDLPVGYYYATNQQGQEALHAITLDDTWKLIGCGQPVVQKSAMQRQIDASEFVRHRLMACWSAAHLSAFNDPGMRAVSVRFDGRGEIAEITNATKMPAFASPQALLYGNPGDDMVGVARSCHIVLDADQREILRGKTVVMGWDLKSKR